MSSQLTVFVNKIPNSGLVNLKIEECSFPDNIALDDEVSIHKGGYFPINLNDEISGIELYIGETIEEFELLAEKLIGYKYALTFSWSSSEKEARIGHFLATVFKRCFAALVLDPQTMHYLSFDELTQLNSGEVPKFYEDWANSQAELVEYLPQKNKQGLFDNCQRCKWRYPTSRDSVLCLECAARCPVCDCYKMGCVDPGVFEIGSRKKYWLSVRLLHQQAGQELDWFEYLE